MSKDIHENVPENAVEVVVRTERDGADWMHLYFRAEVKDPAVLIRLIDALHMHTEYITAFESMLDRIGGMGSHRTPRFVVEDDKAVMLFECYGEPMMAENVAEAFEIYLHEIEGVYTYVVPSEK